MAQVVLHEVTKVFKGGAAAIDTFALRMDLAAAYFFDPRMEQAIPAGSPTSAWSAPPRSCLHRTRARQVPSPR